MTQTEPNSDTETPGVCVSLTDRRVLRVAGADARGFLQNLLTCDLDDVDAALEAKRRVREEGKLATQDDVAGEGVRPPRG